MYRSGTLCSTKSTSKQKSKQIYNKRKKNHTQIKTKTKQSNQTKQTNKKSKEFLCHISVFCKAVSL